MGEIRKGKIFIYPTDTIYGLGCNFLNSESVEKIRDIKRRDGRPFSVIAPGKDWIRKNCVVNDKVEKWLDKLPGPYTLILDTDGGSLGVRIPDNWFSLIVEKAGVPFVTTSVNISGKNSMEKLEDLDTEIEGKVDYIIYDGKLGGKASKIINLTGGEEKIIER